MAVIMKISCILFIIVMMIAHNKLQARYYFSEDDSDSEEFRFKLRDDFPRRVANYSTCSISISIF
jgi:hypothetical protein